MPACRAALRLAVAKSSMPSSAISRAARCAMRLRRSLRPVSFAMTFSEQLVLHFLAPLPAGHAADERLRLAGRKLLVEIVEQPGLRVGHLQAGFRIDAHPDHAV